MNTMTAMMTKLDNVPGECRNGRREEENQDQRIAEPFNKGEQQALGRGRGDQVRSNRIEDGRGVGRAQADLRWNATVEGGLGAEQWPGRILPAPLARRHYWRRASLRVVARRHWG